MTASPMRTPLNEGIQRLQDEGRGLLTLSIVQPADFPHVVADAVAGDADASLLLQQVIKVMDSIRSAPRKRTSLCGACPQPLRLDVGFAIVVATPACDDPSAGLALAICTRCGSDRATIQDKATLALSRFWPDLRPITITGPGGRA